MKTGRLIDFRFVNYMFIKLILIYQYAYKFCLNYYFGAHFKYVIYMKKI